MLFLNAIFFKLNLNIIIQMIIVFNLILASCFILQFINSNSKIDLSGIKLKSIRN